MSQCCRRTDCRGTVTTVLAYLARNGCESSGGLCTERRLFPPLQSETSLEKISFDSQWLRKSYQKLFPQRGFAKSHRKAGSRKGGYQVVSGLLQPPLSCPQTEQKMETNLGSNSVKPVLEDQFLQDGNSGDDPVILTDRGMGNLAGLSDAYFHIPINQRSRKYLRFFLNNQTFQFTVLPFGLATAPLEFTKVVKEGVSESTNT